MDDILARAAIEMIIARRAHVRTIVSASPKMTTCVAVASLPVAENGHLIIVKRLTSIGRFAVS